METLADNSDRQAPHSDQKDPVFLISREKLIPGNNRTLNL